MHFIVTDTAQTIPVVYTGLLPDLFKEGKGVVAQGTLRPDGMFSATEVLAKHDENYMPPEAEAALDQAHRTRETAMPSLQAARRFAMIPELGQFALILALLVALAQGIVPLLGAARRDAALMALARARRRARSSSLVAIAFGCLA